ncbi:MAG: aldo/keto reductase [Verrucomicrobia bacterium]|nr:aldo/keto reductase [Verrucomicrobiota bacterium]
MDYKDFGRTGVKVSPLCLGCMNFGAKTSPEDAYDIIDHAVDAGINFIDTANVYSRGRSEEVLGEALKRNGKRDRIILATKVNGAMADDDPNMQGISRRHIIEQCDASLKRLKTDVIDLYQLHRPRSETAIDESLRALDDLVRAGKVRYIGSSFFLSWKFVESLWASKDLGLNRFVSEQPPYTILDRRIERDLIPMAQSYGIALMPFGPLAGGLLSGKYTEGQNAPEGTRYAETDNWRQDIRFNEASLTAAQKVSDIADAKGVPVAEFSTAWVLNQPAVTSPIIGPRTMDQLEAYLRALEVEITEEDQKAVDAIVAPGEHVTAYYQEEFSDFGPNYHRW